MRQIVIELPFILYALAAIATVIANFMTADTDIVVRLIAQLTDIIVVLIADIG